MGFSHNLLWLVFGMISFFLFSGCGDLEPEMQDTRTVVLKMNFNQRSSSRNSSVSQAEVSSHKTHLILALPAWEPHNSSYRNYYSSFAQELMNPLDNKVSMKIPLNTQMKIFAFLFKQDYTMPQLFSGVREVGYYGKSKPFSIGTNTNNLSLGITLESTGTSDGDVGDSDGGGSQGGTDSTADITAPTVSLIPATITSSGFAVVQSTETGKAFLVNTDVTVSNLTSIENTADNMSNSVVINSANTNTNLSAAGLVKGTYKAYAVDADSNLSNASLDNVTIAGQLVDIDGNVYRTVVIGTQHWMAENLKVTRYRNGVNITYVSNNGSWSGLTTGAYGYYGNNTTNRDTYGILYNWHAVDDSRGICPEGWHVPSRTEFDTLSTYLGGDSIAGSKLKEAGTVHWDFPNSGGTNESGFTALPAGSRLFSNGSYNYLGTVSHFWSSESSGSNMRRLKHDVFTLESVTFVKNMGFSIRCLKDN